MREFVFYTTQGCHLCDLAIELIQPLLPQDVSVELIEISDSAQLIAAYGTRIPVVADTKTGRELGWPFDQQQWLDFINHP